MRARAIARENAREQAWLRAGAVAEEWRSLQERIQEEQRSKLGSEK